MARRASLSLGGTVVAVFTVVTRFCFSALNFQTPSNPYICCAHIMALFLSSALLCPFLLKTGRPPANREKVRKTPPHPSQEKVWKTPPTGRKSGRPPPNQENCTLLSSSNNWPTALKINPSRSKSCFLPLDVFSLSQ